MTEPEAISTDRLEEELAAVAREIAGLLLRPEHDEAEVAALDERAGVLRQQLAGIREGERRLRERSDLWLRRIAGLSR